MTIAYGTKDDLDTIIALEEEYFTKDKAEVKEAYELVLELGGQVWIDYRDNMPTGMLATVPVTDLLKKRIRSLPANSPFRKRIENGYLDDYDGYDFVMAFVPSVPSSLDLIHTFLSLEKAVGFVYADSENSLDFYKKRGCRIAGNVQSIHSPEEYEFILVRESI